MRRTALKTLLLGVAGAAALPTRASAQSCTPPCYAISNAEAASGTTIATEFERIWLAHKLVSSSGTSVHTVRNHFQGITMELAGSNDVGVHIGNPQSTNNFVQFAWNGIGPAVNDVTNANTIISDVGGARFNNVRVNAPTPTGTGTQISFGNTTSTNVGAAGGAEVLPAAPLGYLVADYGGEKIKIPFYRA